MTQIKDEYEEPKFTPPPDPEASTSAASTAATGPAEAVQFDPVSNDAPAPPETSVKDEEESHADVEAEANSDADNNSFEPPHAHFGNIPCFRSGRNDQGSIWCNHGFGIYHYINPNGSIYFRNPDRSSYFWDPVRGFSRYVDPNGSTYVNQNPHPEDELDSFCFHCKYMP